MLFKCKFHQPLRLTNGRKYSPVTRFVSIIKFLSNGTQYGNREIKPIIHWLIIVLLSISTGCNKFVEIDPPSTQIVTQTVFANTASTTAAQVVIYSQMASFDAYQISAYTGMSSDEFKNYSSFTNEIQFYTNSLLPTNNTIQSIWNNAYLYIFEANAVLEGLQNSGTVSEAVKNQLIGEAKFTRAFWHFYLVNLFGNIPLITNTNYQINAVSPRTDKSLVYQQIITDLKDAKNLLNSNFVDASDTTTTRERLRPTKSAAQALLARTYLYLGDWINAEAQATEVIDNTAMFKLEPDLNKVFLKNSTEAIWQLMYTNTFNTVEGAQFILSTTPGTVALNPQLINAFETGDNRRNSWVDSVIVGGNTYYFPYKYKVQASTTVAEYSMALRLSELFLVRSEARAQQENLTGPNSAASDLNTIRNRAGLPNITAVTKADILKAILRERQVELFTEWGHRWLDLKRTGNADDIMSTVAPYKGGSWNTNWQLYPIPQSERNNDPKLTQNKGY